MGHIIGLKFMAQVGLGTLVSYRRNMEAYIDDMVIKSRQVEEHLADLRETF